MAKKKPETIRKEIEKNLRAQLVERGADLQVYQDLVTDYMTLWDLKEQLKEDVRENGLRCEYATATGTVERDNPSAKQLPVVNREMRAILRDLGLTVEDVGGGGGSYVDL